MSTRADNPDWNLPQLANHLAFTDIRLFEAGGVLEAARSGLRACHAAANSSIEDCAKLKQKYQRECDDRHDQSHAYAHLWRAHRQLSLDFSELRDKCLALEQQLALQAVETISPLALTIEDQSDAHDQITAETSTEEKADRSPKFEHEITHSMDDIILTEKITTGLQRTRGPIHSEENPVSVKVEGDENSESGSQQRGRPKKRARQSKDQLGAVA